MEATLTKMQDTLKTILKLPDASGITETTRLFEDLNIDSTTTLEFLIALEEVIPGLVIDPDTLEMEHFRTVGNLLSYVQANTLPN